MPLLAKRAQIRAGNGAIEQFGDFELQVVLRPEGERAAGLLHHRYHLGMRMPQNQGPASPTRNRDSCCHRRQTREREAMSAKKKRGGTASQAARYAACQSRQDAGRAARSRGSCCDILRVNVAVEERGSVSLKSGMYPSP